jgi:hypothetical protein
MRSPCYIKLENSWIILNSRRGPTPDKPEVFLETPQNLKAGEQFLKPAGRGHTGLLQEMECERSAFSDRTAGQSRPRMEMLHAGSGWLLNRSGRVFADVARPVQGVCVADKEKGEEEVSGPGETQIKCPI